jgi:hypothetical protein
MAWESSNAMESPSLQQAARAFLARYPTPAAVLARLPAAWTRADYGAVLTAAGLLDCPCLAGGGTIRDWLSTGGRTLHDIHAAISAQAYTWRIPEQRDGGTQ